MNRREAVEIERALEKDVLSVYNASYEKIVDALKQYQWQGAIPPENLLRLKNRIDEIFVSLNTAATLTITNSLARFIGQSMQIGKTELSKILFNLSPNLKIINLESPALTEPFIRNLLRQGTSTISSRIWVDGNIIKRKLMRTISTLSAQGMSAESMIPYIKPFLIDPEGYGMMNGLVKRYRTLADKIWDVDPAKAREFMRKAKEVDALIPRLGPGVYRSAYKNAWRLAVTEFNNACQAANLEYYKTLPFIKGAKWNLNPIGHHCETCLGYAGKTFTLENYPDKPHPICRCFPTSVRDTDYLKQKYGIE